MAATPWITRLQSFLNWRIARDSSTALKASTVLSPAESIADLLEVLHDRVGILEIATVTFKGDSVGYTGKSLTFRCVQVGMFSCIEDISHLKLETMASINPNRNRDTFKQEKCADLWGEGPALVTHEVWALSWSEAYTQFRWAVAICAQLYKPNDPDYDHGDEEEGTAPEGWREVEGGATKEGA